MKKEDLIGKKIKDSVIIDYNDKGIVVKDKQGNENCIPVEDLTAFQEKLEELDKIGVELDANTKATVKKISELLKCFPAEEKIVRTFQFGEFTETEEGQSLWKKTQKAEEEYYEAIHYLPTNELYSKEGYEKQFWFIETANKFNFAKYNLFNAFYEYLNLNTQ